MERLSFCWNGAREPTATPTYSAKETELVVALNESRSCLITCESEREHRRNYPL